jgi:Na+/H+ antiporter NhaD/arsenite permease-like protein
MTSEPQTRTGRWISLTTAGAVLVVGLLLYVAIHPSSVPSKSAAEVAQDYAAIAANPNWPIGCVPFAALLLAIAVFPAIPFLSHWWERNSSKLLVSCTLGLAATLWLAYSNSNTFIAVRAVLHGMHEYVPFIILLLSLFVIAGGISVGGRFSSNPRMNTVLLAIGAVLANLLGTTGASMLLIRPLLRANAHRQCRTHTVVFFIFVVSNCGGLLLPIGDPPLFLGYLRGVPFEWTLTLWKPWLFVNAAILAIYYLVDMRLWKREGFHHHRAGAEHVHGITVHGHLNVVLLLLAVAAVATISPGKPLPFGGPAAPELLREAALLLLAGASFAVMPLRPRVLHGFSFAPIGEVAAVFSGLFVAMQVPMIVLAAKGGDLGIGSPLSFFWVTGALSSVLDNAPTYVVFLEVARSLTPPMVADGTLALADGEFVRSGFLAAISCGAVFMGAMTYIGNGPNLMVRAIAEKEGVSMPSFGGYILWSCAVLLPVLAAASWIFLR